MGVGALCCPGCGRSKMSWQRHCARRDCPENADRWAKDWRRVLLTNLEAYGGAAVMATVTAPGEDVLPWDRSECLHEPNVKCSGRLGCRVRDEERRRWNATFPARWKRLNDAARLAANREVGRRAGVVLSVGKEAQRRGALHVHVALGYKLGADRLWAQAYVRHLARLAPDHGFGYVDRKLRARNAREAAAYLSRYFVAGPGAKAPVTEAVLNPEMPHRPLYCSVKLTRVTRCTMRNLRRVRHLYVWRRRECPRPIWCGEAGEPPTHLELVVEFVANRLAVPEHLRARERLAPLAAAW